MKQSSTNEPPTPPPTAPTESLPALSDTELISALSERIAFLEGQLALSEARLSQMTAAVQESAEDLQQFGGCFLRPSIAGIIGYTAENAEVTINGTPLQRRDSIPPETWKYMEALAKNLNRQNSARRKAAGIPDPPPVNMPDPPTPPNPPKGTP